MPRPHRRRFFMVRYGVDMSYPQSNFYPQSFNPQAFNKQGFNQQGFNSLGSTGQAGQIPFANTLYGFPQPSPYSQQSPIPSQQSPVFAQGQPQYPTPWASFATYSACRAHCPPPTPRSTDSHAVARPSPPDEAAPC